MCGVYPAGAAARGDDAAGDAAAGRSKRELSRAPLPGESRRQAVARGDDDSIATPTTRTVARGGAQRVQRGGCGVDADDELRLAGVTGRRGTIRRRSHGEEAYSTPAPTQKEEEKRGEQRDDSDAGDAAE